MFGIFKRKVLLPDAYKEVARFMSGNAEGTLDFLLKRGDPFILRQDRFGLRRAQFPEYWTYGSFALANTLGSSSTSALRYYALRRVPRKVDPIRRFLGSTDLSRSEARYEFIRCIFDAAFNDPEFDRDQPTIDSSRIEVAGKVFLEMLSCARYVDFVCSQVKVVD
jgi:hypothetical protein